MLIKIKCEQCGQEKEIDLKVPKYCSKECRLLAFKKMVAERMKKKENPQPPQENAL